MSDTDAPLVARPKDLRSGLVVWLTLLMAATVLGAAADRAPTAPAGFTLVWSDEFEVDGSPDPTKWTFERGFVRNRELQWYQPENARCEHGLLIIEAKRETTPNPRHEPGNSDWRRARAIANYTSACVTTRGLHAWQYGRIEVRARIEARAGLWPAIWTLGAKGRWPHNGEVDLMEYYRGMILANTFWAKAGSAQPDGVVVKKPLADFFGPGWAERFHVWRMEWDETEIRLFVDDVLLQSTTLDEAQRIQSDGPHPFRQPHYLLLNLAVGGQGGDPGAMDFPARFEVDYVRVYQRID